jgi:hypothetical protein
VFAHIAIAVLAEMPAMLVGVAAGEFPHTVDPVRDHSAIGDRQSTKRLPDVTHADASHRSDREHRSGDGPVRRDVVAATARTPAPNFQLAKPFFAKASPVSLGKFITRT